VLKAFVDGGQERAIRPIKITPTQVRISLCEKDIPKQLVKEEHSSLKPNLLHPGFKKA
jgi:hypothetical protein